MCALQERIVETIHRRRLFRPGQRILVAVSGGVDSIVLLDVLYRLGKEHRWQLTVAHLNHRLRGKNSNADERLVRRVAQKLGLAAVVERADVRGFMREHKVSLEMAARTVRHKFLARTARRLKIPVVALAHHLDDQVELFFLRLLRGSGTEGLAGMKWRNPSPFGREVQLVRPLLEESKTVLRQYAKERKLAYREDASNATAEIQRNRLRHELLPFLKQKYQPALERIIQRTMNIIGSEGEVVTQLANDWLNRVRSAVQSPKSKVQSPKSKVTDVRGEKFFGSELVTKEFERLPVAVQRSCLRLQLLQKGVPGDYELIERLRLFPDRITCVERAQTGRLPAGSETSLTATHKSSIALKRDTAGLVHWEVFGAGKFNRGLLPIPLDGQSGRADLDGVRVRWKVALQPGRLTQSRQAGIEFFDAEKVGSPILLRHWQAGDRFQPIGLCRNLKLQDFFTNEKVPRRLRHELLLATTSAGEIFWVEGMRISERFKLTQATKRRLQWAWKRN